MPASFHIVTYGCQMNRHDSAVLEGTLLAHGYRRAGKPEDADVIIFNTCAVRQHAEDRLFSNLGHLKRFKKRRRTVIGVVGCVAQKEGAAIIQRMPHVDFVVGAGALREIPRMLRDGRYPLVDTRLAGGCGAPSSSARLERPWSAFVAAMRGCNNFCAYCVVPYVRGPEVSRPPDEVVEDVRKLAAAGVSEITLLGQNIDAYGKHLTPPADLAGLLERVAAVAGVRRIRFVTSHPRDISERLVQAARGIEPVCEYFHVPAQAGSDRILAAMNRGYSRARYLEVLAMIRQTLPAAGIVSDFIVGFPGERPADFDDTVRLVEEARFQSAYIFKYSPRPGTRAAELADDVPAAEKAHRHALLSRMQKQISLEENQKAVDRQFEVLVEGASPRDATRLIGRTRDFRIVILPAGTASAGEYKTARISAATALALYSNALPSTKFGA